jgi:formylglycine-generating enzyme required for sulfatase activity
MWEAAAWLQNSTKNAVWSDSSPKGSQTVASFGYAASTGLADLFGNVWEWTADSFYPYPALSGGFSGHAEKAVRGGSWANESAAMDLESRGGIPADHGSAFLGFRPAILRK